MSSLGISTDVEASEIGITLNGVIFYIFLMGMYTVLYFGTMYIYFERHPSKYHPVPAAMTLLYLSSMGQTAVQWFATKWAFVDNGDTRDTVFEAIFGDPVWVLIAVNSLTGVTFVIADGLLIWRCFHVWNRSWRMISLPLFFIFTEFALFLTEVAFDAKFDNDPMISASLGATINNILAAAFFISFGTTLVTTVLIAYRIYSVTKQQGASARRFKHVIDIVVQSGAVYALAQLAIALVGVVPGFDTLQPRNIAFASFSQALSFSLAGISSTVMVARVALLPADTVYPSTSVHLSGLQFHVRSTSPTADMEAIEVSHSVDGDSGSVGDKVQ